MHAYPAPYLDEIVETQGLLFEEVSARKIDFPRFVTAYMGSKTRGWIDAAYPYVCTKNYLELWDYFLEQDGFVPVKGEPVSGFAANWLGQFYAYYQWYWNLPSWEVLDRLPVERMLISYLGLHDLDLELAVIKVGKDLST